MTPTILTEKGAIKMVLGTPGGSTIITSVFQTIINVDERGMNAQQAVDAPRVHHQLLPKDQIAYNPQMSAKTQFALESMGYQLKKHNYMGDVQLLLKQGHQWQAAADSRGRGHAQVIYKGSKSSQQDSKQ